MNRKSFIKNLALGMVAVPLAVPSMASDGCQDKETYSPFHDCIHWTLPTTFGGTRQYAAFFANHDPVTAELMALYQDCFVRYLGSSYHDGLKLIAYELAVQGHAFVLKERNGKSLNNVVDPLDCYEVGDGRIFSKDGSSITILRMGCDGWTTYRGRTLSKAGWHRAFHFLMAKNMLLSRACSVSKIEDMDRLIASIQAMRHPLLDELDELRSIQRMPYPKATGMMKERLFQGACNIRLVKMLYREA